jgi:predicted small lipoprotein YifL
MRFFSSMLLVVALAACGDKDTLTTPTSAAVVGVWTLESINGNRLPLMVERDEGEEAELVSQVVTFTQDGKFSMTAQHRVSVNGQFVTENDAITGTWQLNGTTVSVKFDDDPEEQVAGVLNGNTMTFDDEDEDVTFVFRRQ